MGLMRSALAGLLRRRFTQKYPKVKPSIPGDFRGKLHHDRGKCIYCGLCEKYCPSAAITVDREKKIWRHDLGKCLFCAQCEETCHLLPKRDAIKMSTEFELAVLSQKELVRVHTKP
jgi:formate hydrogenlyase subunit 6/NADH:ubiquinone oxidoreductase subunit I